MNKKGFTLVELMAVIVIISIVALVGVTSITGVRKQMDKKLFEEKLNSAISSAEKWGEDNKDMLPTTKTIGQLIVSNYYESEEAVNPNLYNYKCDGEDNKDPKGYLDGELCKNIVTNNVDNLIVNDIKLSVNIKNNRVYACIIKDSNNNNLLVTPDKYNSGLYCGD